MMTREEKAKARTEHLQACAKRIQSGETQVFWDRRHVGWYNPDRRVFMMIIDDEVKDGDWTDFDYDCNDSMLIGELPYDDIDKNESMAYQNVRVCEFGLDEDIVEHCVFIDGRRHALADADVL